MKFQRLLECLINLNEDENRKTIALVPGSFKPPTAGHLDMVKKYAEQADEVYIIISAPGKAKRITSLGTEITPDIALKIWEIYIEKAGLIEKVHVSISPKASPIRAAYEYAEKELKDVDVIFGASKKEDDFKRWNTVSKYMSEHNPSITVVDPEKSAVEPFEVGGKAVSATDIRNNIGEINKLKELLPTELTDEDIEKIQALLT